MEYKLGKYLVLGRFLRTAVWIDEFLVENKIDIIYKLNSENAKKIMNEIIISKKDYNRLVIIDLDDWPSFYRDNSVNLIMHTGKNYGVNLIMTTTYPVHFPPEYANQLERVVNLHDGPIPRSVPVETLTFYGLLSDNSV